jgi:hypothetical protein
LNCWFAALGATVIALHPELIFALPGNGQARELVVNAFSHRLPERDTLSFLCQSSIPTTETSMASLGRNRGNCHPLVSAKKVENQALA